MSKLRTIAALIISISIAVGATGKAQNDDKAPLNGSRPVYHEISFGGIASASGILQTFNKEIKPYFNVGGGAQINYALYFNENISLVFGAVAKYCQSTYRLDILDESSTHKWQSYTTEDNFLFNAEIRDYTETHSALYIQIPLLFGYEAGTTLAKWYINVGAAAQLTVYGKYRSKISHLKTSGYTKSLNMLKDSLSDLGFGTAKNVKVDGKPMLKFTVNSYVETGAKISISKGSWLYVGAFGEISVLKNSITESSRKHVINYAPTAQKSNNTLNYLNVTSITNTKYTSGGRTYAFGGVVRIGFDFCNSDRMLSNSLR